MMSAKTLTLDEIKQQYPNQWVLVEFTKLDEDLNVLRGRVVETASSKGELYRKLVNADVKKFAIEYTGELSQDEVYLL